MPGLGTDYQHHLLRYKHLAPFDVICAADESSGTVKPRVGNPLAPDIQFHFHQNDVDLMRKGLGILSDICWAAGAQSILPGLNGIPEVIRNKEEAEIIRNYPLNANDTIAASNHAFCTTRMSSDPTRGVVNESGRCHDLDNLYIADTSIFAASSGVNPMLLCMALSDYIASEIATR
jgi:choline dehydrogenase-like flavoprotein